MNGETSKIALVTGAGAGIGQALTRRLLAEGWEVAAVIRSGFSEEDAAIRDAGARGQLRVYQADLTDFSRLRQVLTEIRSREHHLDLLFNNAGGSLPELKFSPQGRELHYELQTVVPYIVYMELKALLLKGTAKTVVNTSSQAMRQVKPPFEPETLPRPAQFRQLFGPYAATKLALSLWTQALAAQAADEGIQLVSVDPGGNNTLRSTKKSGLPPIVKLIMRWFFPHPSHGAGRLWHAALHARTYAPGAYVVKGRPAALPFAASGAKVLDMVRAVYEAEIAT